MASTMSNEFLLERLPPVRYKGPHPMREMFAVIIDDLPEEDRLIIEAIFFEGISLSEAAHRLGLGAKQSAHYRVNRALEMIRKKLEEQDYDIDSGRISSSVGPGDEDILRGDSSAANNTNT